MSGKLSGLIKRMQEQQGNSTTPVEIKEALLALDSITDRPGGDTRPLNQRHVESLAESIAVLGLIEPIVVDQAGRLLAGGHRRAALHLLQNENPDAFAKHFLKGMIPVRLMPLDAEQDPDLAIAIETAENEQRRDYTAAEVKAIAERLRTAGYMDVKGRPKKGDKPLMPALEAVIGKSIRTVRRYLNDDVEESRTPDRLLPFRRAYSALQQLHQMEPTTEAEQDLAKLLPRVEKAIARVLEEKI